MGPAKFNLAGIRGQGLGVRKSSNHRGHRGTQGRTSFNRKDRECGTKVAKSKWSEDSDRWSGARGQEVL